MPGTRAIMEARFASRYFGHKEAQKAQRDFLAFCAFCASLWQPLVGVGIEPTFRVFQTRANPSQLSDRPGGPDFSSPPSLLVVNLVHDFTIIVHVHEQVLAPLGSCFGIVTKHHAFELHSQRCLRSQQRHACFRRCAIALPVVALDASRNNVHRRVISTTRPWQDVIER